MTLLSGLDAIPSSLEFLPNGLHPNNEGFKIMTDSIVQTIQELVPSPPPAPKPPSDETISP